VYRVLHIWALFLDVNNNSVEIRKRILLANKCFYGLKKRQFRSQFLSIKNKVKLYKTLIRPVLAYGAETWVVSKSDETILRVFERKNLRAIFLDLQIKTGNGEKKNIIMSYIHCIKKVTL
jgi:hypothetical protein